MLTETRVSNRWRAQRSRNLHASERRLLAQRTQEREEQRASYVALSYCYSHADSRCARPLLRAEALRLFAEIFEQKWTRFFTRRSSDASAQSISVHDRRRAMVLG